MTRKQLQPRQEVSSALQQACCASEEATSLMTNESDAVVPLMGIYKSVEALLQEVPLSGELVPERNAFKRRTQSI